MTKILFLINTLTGGGAEKVLTDLVNSLPNKYDITVQTVDNSGLYINQLNKNIHYKTINNKKGLLRKIFNRFLTFNLHAKWVYSKYVKGDYDIEVAFLEGLPTKILSASTNTKAKKIAWVHIDLMDYFGSNAVYKNCEEHKKAYEQFDKIACVSDAVKEKFIERFGNDTSEKLETVYNIVLDENIKEKGEELLENVSHDYPILVSCGRLCEQKGFDRLLHIHKKLLDENIRHYLWIVGEGNMRSQFENYIKKNNLQDTVTLWGFQSNPYKYIKNADLFVCSSVAEGYSMVITESAVLGTPIIATDVAGVKEPKDHPRCYKITENDEDSLYIAVKEILSDEEELKKAKDYTVSISKYFNRDALLENIVNFLGEKE